MKNKNIIHLTVGSIATNCWIYPLGEKNALVIDPGDEADLIISTLKKYDLVPAYILLTHGHFDHIGAVANLAAAFSQVKPQIAIHHLDSEYLGPDAYKAQSASVKAAMGDTSFIDSMWNDMPPPDLLLEEGGTVGPFTVLHLPGHTPGSAAFWDKEENVLFTGDTLFEGAYGRTDLPGGSEDAIVASLRRLFAMDAGIKVYPGHGNTTTIGREAGRLF
jgi:glyoxylase-like metal-dependent hydrolase (beta-lactamase superfamily II)